MKYYFGILIGLCIVIILFITRCDVSCQKTKAITESLQKAKIQQEYFNDYTSKAGEYWNLYKAELEKAKQAKLGQWSYEKKASNIYGSGLAFGNYAYALWDEGLTGTTEEIKVVETGLVIAGHSDRDLILMSRVCGTAKGRSPMCNNWAMYYSGKQIFEDAGVPRGIALGIMNAESNIGVNYAGTCDSSRNNRGGIKYRKNADGSVTKDQAIPNNGCRLYKFDTIEDYFKSKANTLGIGYKACFDGRDQAIKCISYAYVGNSKVAEPSWIKNVAKIAE